jgi:hypothetical protein
VSLEQAAVYFAAIAAFASMVATFVAHSQMREATRANMASVFLAFSSRYNEPVIADSIRKLIDWRRGQNDGFADLWFSQFKKGDDEALALNAARRTMSRYFGDVVRAYQDGLLSRKLARSMTSNFGLLVYYDIAMPMNVAMFGADVLHIPNALRKIGPDYNGATRLSAEVVGGAAEALAEGGP